MFIWVNVCSTQPLGRGIQSAFRRVRHQRPRRRRRRRVYFGPFRNNPENNRVDQIVTRPKTLLYYSFVLFLTSAFLLRGRYRRTDRPRRNGNNTPHLVLHIATWPNLLPTWLGSRVVSVLDSGVVGPGFKSQPRRRQVTVLGKLFTSIVLLFT